MTKEWVYKEAKIGSTRALTHKITGELSIFGNYGQIFVVNSTTCKARIFNFRRIKRPLGYRIGDEAVFSFPLSDLNKWEIIIDKPPTIWRQQECAEADRLTNRNFGGNHETT